MKITGTSKRITSAIVSIITLALLSVSCSSTLEERARKQMKITMNNEFKYASEFEISKENVIFSNDSVFIMVFHIKGKKDNGEIAEGEMEYAYEEVSMRAWGHPEVIAWDDYFHAIKPFGKNSVESYLELMKEMEKEGYSMHNYTPFGIFNSALFAVGRKVPSDFSQKCDIYKKEKESK